MKNTIKKITAIAMAFTLLGTGTAISKSVNPQSSSTLVANAADYCPSHNGTYTYDSYDYVGIVERNGKHYIEYNRFKATKCAVCGKLLKRVYVGKAYSQELVRW
ncbi:hypothetical protein [Ruminococcus flavefaciens]|uniref:Uncharacterized protein n=1 Tax=Ruminococcus flavefaciens TaxID=1265 RepID=A0A1M7G9C5_RUMFL|nr:hypothetical protein [Ruminococcus flavefaciens]SHM12459.1 hypothetical protein SAMN04487860_101121 [Ruminococcus flavefaciens]